MKFSRLQRRILALLQEAGEESVFTLANRVAEPTGDPAEMSAMCEAITGLYDAGLVELADRRDSVSLTASKTTHLKVLVLKHTEQ